MAALLILLTVVDEGLAALYEPAPRDLTSRRRPATEVIHFGRW
jgi:hypothetical protein